MSSSDPTRQFWSTSLNTLRRSSTKSLLLPLFQSGSDVGTVSRVLRRHYSSFFYTSFVQSREIWFKWLFTSRFNTFEWDSVLAFQVHWTRERKVTVFSLFYRNRKWYHPDRYFHDWTKKLTEQNFSFRVLYQAFRRNWMCSETKLFINSVFSELWFQGKTTYEYSHFTLTAGSCTVGTIPNSFSWIGIG